MEKLINVTYSLQVAKYYFEIQKIEKQQFLGFTLTDPDLDWFFDDVEYEVSLKEGLSQNKESGANEIKEQIGLLRAIKTLWDEVKIMPICKKNDAPISFYGFPQKRIPPIANTYLIKRKGNVHCVGQVRPQGNKILWDEWDRTDKKNTSLNVKYRFYFDFDKLPEDEQILFNSYSSSDILGYCSRISTLINKYVKQEKEKVTPPQRRINEEKLSPYFKATFKGKGGGSIDNFSKLIPDLKAEQTAKGFAQIALMIYESRNALNDRKPKTFKEWYSIFCECVGCEKKTYQPKDLRSPSENLKRLFSYL